jgi:DNA-binding MarR family transcriptional regulator
MATSSARDFGILLGLAYQGFVDQLHVDLAGRGFTDLGPAYGYVVRALAAEPQLHQRDLARRLGITEPGAKKIVDAMVRRRYVTRVADPDDGRAYQLRLGVRGLALLAAARRFHARFERRLAAADAGAVAATRRVLEAIVAASADDTAHGRLRAT